MAKHPSHILELARKGAEVRYQELKTEIAALVKVFPHLAQQAGTALGRAVGKTEARLRRSRTMSAAARKAVSERMKKYWAARRAGQKR
jgi:hypothetical protein